jgi:hypothetical protein
VGCYEPFVGHFEVRLEFVGTFRHAVKQTLRNRLVNAEPEEFYLVRGLFLERLLEYQQPAVLVHHLRNGILGTGFLMLCFMRNLPSPQMTAPYPRRKTSARL